MTNEEKERLLKEIKECIQFSDFGTWYLQMEASDYEFKSECDSLEEYKQSTNYLIGQLLKDKDI